MAGTISRIAVLIFFYLIKYSQAEDFFYEFFHQDHGDQARNIVVLGPDRPDQQIESLLSMPEFNTKVTYIQGDPLKD